MSVPSTFLPSPAQFIQSFRRRFVNLHLLWQTTGVPHGISHSTPDQQPIKDSDLSRELNSLLANFRKTHPKSHITWERHMSTADGKVVRVIEDKRELPPDKKIIVVSQTISLNTEETAKVLTDLFVGRITS